MLYHKVAFASQRRHREHKEKLLTNQLSTHQLSTKKSGLKVEKQKLKVFLQKALTLHKRQKKKHKKNLPKNQISTHQLSTKNPKSLKVEKN
ncbi:MAG: hypothetical protein IPM77_16200 [Crocinitomicaceae bacterium]|nr:hypothetical protein [Crocinitomicaceae bacterium]